MMTPTASIGGRSGRWRGGSGDGRIGGESLGHGHSSSRPERAGGQLGTGSAGTAVRRAAADRPPGTAQSRAPAQGGRRRRSATPRSGAGWAGSGPRRGCAGPAAVSAGDRRAGLDHDDRVELEPVGRVGGQQHQRLGQPAPAHVAGVDDRGAGRGQGVGQLGAAATRGRGRPPGPGGTAATSSAAAAATARARSPVVAGPSAPATRSMRGSTPVRRTGRGRGQLGGGHGQDPGRPRPAPRPGCGS